jgi:hypothetical protein
MKGRDTLVALFALGWLLLSWPLLSIVAQPPRALLGVPVLVLYLFGVWAGIIVVLAWLTRQRGSA